MDRKIRRMLDNLPQLRYYFPIFFSMEIKTMIGLGTIINTAAILVGGLCGALFGRFLHDSAQDTLTKVCGVSTLFIAITGALEEMLEPEGFLRIHKRFTRCCRRPG